MKRKGFTLVELLVVIAIIALLMGILMPALAKVRQVAYRMMCGTNLSGIGKAMLLYSNDYDEEYPRAGGSNKTRWISDGIIANWQGQTCRFAFLMPPDATITSSFYLLVRYSEVDPKSFVCKGDLGTKVFKLTSAGATVIRDLTDAWDFGGGGGTSGLKPGQYCSYSYNMPYRFTRGSNTNARNPVSAASNSARPVAGDRNPYLDRNANPVDGLGYIEGEDDEGAPPSWLTGTYLDEDRTGNSAAHQREGQNVLFNDGSIFFERYPNCGIDNDNLWKCWTMDNPTEPEDIQKGPDDYRNILTGTGIGGPWDVKDAYLVNEDNFEN